jgi:predicted transposase YdaD
MTFLKDNSIKDDTSVPGLVEAKEVLKRSNMTEAERNIYLRHIEAMRNEKSATDYSYASGKVDGRAEGRAEGLAEGLAEGEKKGEHQKALSIARAMKQHGDDIGYIAAITGLTPDEIAAL